MASVSGPQDHPQVQWLIVVKLQRNISRGERCLGQSRGTGCKLSSPGGIPQDGLNSPKTRWDSAGELSCPGGLMRPSHASTSVQHGRDPRLREESRCLCRPHVCTDSAGTGSPSSARVAGAPGLVPDTPKGQAGEQSSQDMASGLLCSCFCTASPAVQSHLADSPLSRSIVSSLESLNRDLVWLLAPGPGTGSGT